MFKDYKIILPVDTREKIQHWVDKADKEISGLGDAWIDMENKTIKVTDAFLIKQECTSSETEMDDEAIAKAMFEAHKDEEESIPRSLKFWWHSHVNMGVFWSGTDVDTMHKLSEHGWFCNIVFNKKREMLGAISYPYKQEILGLCTEGVHYESGIDIKVECFTEEEIKEMDESFKENYKEKTYAVTTYKGGQTNLGEYNFLPGDLTDHDNLCLWSNGYKCLSFNPNNNLIYIETEFKKECYTYRSRPGDIYTPNLKEMDLKLLDQLYGEISHIPKHKREIEILEGIIEEKEKELNDSAIKELMEGGNNAVSTLN